MFKRMNVGAKIMAGFGLLIGIVLILGGMAVIDMKSASGESKKLSQEYIPEVDVAMVIRGAVNRVMYDMRGYGFTEEQSYY